MPLIDDNKVEELLNHVNNSTRVVNVDVEVKRIGSGNHGNHDSKENGNGTKKNGNQLRDTESKADVGVLAALVGNKAAGQMLGIGATQVSQYSRGLNGSNVSSLELKKELEERLGFLEQKAIDKVDLFLDMIAAEKVIEMKGSDLANSAEKMVNVFDKLRRRNEKIDNLTNKPTINIYGPAQVKSDTYISKEV